jgi:hypothetical protein
LSNESRQSSLFVQLTNPAGVPSPAQPTTNMKLPPEPPLWLGVCLAALIGAVFIGAIIALHYFTR